MIDELFSSMQEQIDALRVQLSQQTFVSQRAETADGARSFTYANAPRAAQGGVGAASQFVTLVWITNGRKSGEGAGAGTGVLAVYDATINDYRAVGGTYDVVTI